MYTFSAQNVCSHLELVKGILHGELVAVEPFTELKQILHLLPTMGGGLEGGRKGFGGGEGKRHFTQESRIYIAFRCMLQCIVDCMYVYCEHGLYS